MELQSWHISAISMKEDEEATFREVKKLLLAKGLVSVIDESQKTFQKFTHPLGLNIPSPIIGIPSSDLLSKPDNSALCYVRLLETSEDPQSRSFGLDLIIVSMDRSVGAQLLAECQSALGGQEAVRGTSLEAQIAKSLEEQVKEGTHTKLLSDPEFTLSLESLYDPTIRQQFRSFVDTFGDSAISGTLIEEILPRVGDLKKSEIRRLINNENWFSKQFSIGCYRCGAFTLAFSTRKEAQESLKPSISRKCFRCAEDTLDVIETFALREALLKGLTEGLWLEHLVHQIIQPVSVFSSGGIIFENFEIDVVSVSWENIILFECKDTSFGERDFWMSVPKAQALDANVLWIVTTQPLHDNVKNALDRQKGQVRFKIFITEKLADQQSIASDISQKLEQVQNSFLANLLTPEARLYPYYSSLHPYYSSLRRRLLRRPPTRKASF